MGRLNADLANDLGNLFNRALSMTHKYFEGKVPTPAEEFTEDAELKHLGFTAMQGFQENFGEFRTARALESLWELVRGLNKYIDQTAPWTLYKNKQTARLGTVLYVVLEHMRKIAVHLWPVMPEASEKMLEQLGMPFDRDKIMLEVLPLTNYVRSAEEHQHHLERHPEDCSYCHIPDAVLNRYRNQ